MIATNNAIDMWDWAFWNVIAKWLRSCNDCMLFGIIWIKEGEVEHINGPTHPTHYKWFANSQVECVKRGGYL